ncbi:hypothetical protein [Pigmentiphaga litoralis]|uniref:hypothetical protein n=1 Tax=Pigmentiphaga litoralis TaxID=516702 RepID=UPI00167A23EC|nr:hypothetical protein [Pigmentiphaga litoralis]
MDSGAEWLGRLPSRAATTCGSNSIALMLIRPSSIADAHDIPNRQYVSIAPSILPLVPALRPRWRPLSHPSSLKRLRTSSLQA